MAKISPTIPFSNTLGDSSVYKMEGLDKLVIRAKHGPSKEQIETEPRYAKFRLSQFELKGAGKATSQICLAIFAVTHLKDHNYSGSLTKICRLMQAEDASRPLGERPILFSTNGRILSGFNLNKKIIFDSVLTFGK
jgi:hypothetical protein